MSGIGSIFFRLSAQGTTAYAPAMLGRLQDRRGEPRMRVRVLAALVIVGMLVLTAPLVIVPLAGWLADHL
jgi:hypothetical protein